MISLFIIDFEIKSEENELLKHHLRIARQNPKDIYPPDRIYIKNDIIYCTGKSKAAIANNKAAKLMEMGNFLDAKNLLIASHKKTGLFYPYQYNLGICYIYLKKLRYARLHFTKAMRIVPQYSITYVQLGYIYERWNNENEALRFYRFALRRNKKNISVYTKIGDIYFNRNQYEMAKKYYNESLKRNHRYANGLIGLAKIYFKKERYIKALNMLKSIRTKDEYNKEMHFYYGETAYKLRQYKTARYHYKKLMEFKNDRFFLTTSPSLVKHKISMCNKFIIDF